MGNAEMAQYALYFGSVMFIAVMYFVLRESARRTYKKASKAPDGSTMVRLQVIAKDDTERMTWGILDSLVIKDVNSKNEYPIQNVKFIKTFYPEAGLFASLGVSVQKGIFYEGQKESILQKDDNAEPSNITTIAGALRTEKFIAIANSVLKEFEMATKGNAVNPVVLYAIAGLAVLSTASMLYVMIYMVMPYLERLVAGLGV